MKKNEGKGAIAVILIIVLLLIIAGLCYVIYDLYNNKLDSETQINDLNGQVEKLNGKIEVYEEKLAKITETLEVKKTENSKYTEITGPLENGDVFFVTEAILNDDDTYTLNGVIYEMTDEKNNAQVNDRWKITEKYRTITISKNVEFKNLFTDDIKTVGEKFENYKKTTPQDVANPSLESTVSFEFKDGKCIKVIDELTSI